MYTVEHYENHCQKKGINSKWKRSEIIEKSLKDVLSMPTSLEAKSDIEKHVLILYAINCRIHLFKNRYEKTRKLR